MFNLFGKKQPKPVPMAMRDTLFGDMPMEMWPNNPAGISESEPWRSFIQAREALKKGRKEQAIEALKGITQMPGFEPRHYLQAWHFLRQQGVQPPPEKAKFVYGVVAEVGMGEKGLDLLAAYLDRSARYYNFSGSGIIWEHPDNSLDSAIDTLLDAGRQIVGLIGPWEQARPPAPTGNMVRIHMLTPSGLHFGQGDFASLNADPKGRLLVGAATNLMVQMTEKSQKSR